MRKRRLSDLRRDHDAAVTALRSGAWWNGRAWRPANALPRTAKEATAYRDAHTRLAEILSEMVGGSEAEQVAKARRFARSADADRDEGASTVAEISADEIYEAAKPFFNKKPLRNRAGFTAEHSSRTAWTALAQYVSRLRNDPTITTNRLRMICRQREK